MNMNMISRNQEKEKESQISETTRKIDVYVCTTYVYGISKGLWTALSRIYVHKVF